jgi:hypothetical protein
MNYLTSTHTTPPRHVELNGMLHPIQPLIKANDTARLAELGVYPHITADGPAPLGYTAWTLVDGAYHREPAGTDAERNAALLDQAKAAKYQERLNALLNARNAGFIFNGKRVDSDQDSRILISGAVQLATLALMQGTEESLTQFAAGLGSGWRYSDGSVAATDASGIIALGQALAVHIAHCDAVSQAHKAEIEACVTADECLGLDVTSGYA